MIQTPPVGPLWSPEDSHTATADLFGWSVWRALKSQKSKASYDSNSFSRPSLGLGKTARADLLGWSVWRALKSQKPKARYDSNSSCWPTLGLGRTAGAEPPG